MRIRLLCVGRLKQGAERDLYERYWLRATAAGRAVGLSFHCDEIAESRARLAADRKREEAGSLANLLPPGAHLLALDEGGSSRTSEAFAGMLAAFRDGGTGEIAAVVGGPDGLSPDLLSRAQQVISFGAMTLPHQIVRVLLAEQFYRATTILSGHPYHRG